MYADSDISIVVEILQSVEPKDNGGIARHALLGFMCSILTYLRSSGSISIH